MKEKTFFISLSHIEQKTVGCWPRKLLAAFSILKITDPGEYILSHFLLFDDPFCQFLTFSRYFLENLSKLLPSSAEDRFEGKKSFEERSVFSMIFAFRAKKLRFPANKVSSNAKILID